MSSNSIPNHHYEYVGGGKEIYIDTLASSDGKTISNEDLKKLGLGDAKALEQLKKQMEKAARGEAWKLDVIDTPRGREYKGVIGSDDDEEVEKEGEEENGEGKKKKKVVKGDVEDGKKDVRRKETAGKEMPKTAKPKEKGQKKKQKGSEGSEEEYFKEEL